jgi:hypothetical protein
VIESGPIFQLPTVREGEACYYCDPYSYRATYQMGEGMPYMTCESHREVRGYVHWGLPPGWHPSWRRGIWT